MDRQEKIISVSVLFIVEGQSVNAKELAAGKEDFAAIQDVVKQEAVAAEKKKKGRNKIQFCETEEKQVKDGKEKNNKFSLFFPTKLSLQLPNIGIDIV